MQYFKKINPDNRLLLSNGRYFECERVCDEYGLVATSSEGLIEELQLAIKAERGGIVPISKEDYEELKKKPPEPRLSQSLREELGSKTFNAIHRQSQFANAAAAEMPSMETIQVKQGKESTEIARPKSVKR